MKKILTIFVLTLVYQQVLSQKMLTSWSQQNIEGLTKERFDSAQRLSPEELLTKNLSVDNWCDAFLLLNASINNYSENKAYQQGLANQIVKGETAILKGTSRLMIWDRIISHEILFEGKGLIVENDLFTIAGRANQILQNLTGKNFGNVTISSSAAHLQTLKDNWLSYLSGKSVQEYSESSNENGVIPEISNLKAFEALVVSLKDSPQKQAITKSCLKTVYNMEEMPADKNSSAAMCNPDKYTFAYLAMLVGDKKVDESKNAAWWQSFWDENKNQLVWNNYKGFFEVKK